LSERRSVLFYFDFVSPYSWLALAAAPEFAREHGIAWTLRPVVYAKLLDATGLVGPAEVPVKRRYTFHDVARCARRAGLRLAGPPEHPFRSLESLRTVCLFSDHPRVLDLAVALADAAWGEGRALTDPCVLEAVVRGVGLDPRDLGSRLADPAVKAALRQSTEEALAVGVFGVPTLRLGDELFWGHDRMNHLADRLAGRLGAPAGDAEALLARPRGADRLARPGADGANPR